MALGSGHDNSTIMRDMSLGELMTIIEQTHAIDLKR